MIKDTISIGLQEDLIRVKDMFLARAMSPTDDDKFFSLSRSLMWRYTPYFGVPIFFSQAIGEHDIVSLQ